MSKLKIEPKKMFVIHLNAINSLEAKIKASKVLEGKKIRYIGTMVKSEENGADLGTVAFAEFENIIALYSFSDMGIIELFMNDVQVEGKAMILVFQEELKEQIMKYNTKNIEVVYEGV